VFLVISNPDDGQSPKTQFLYVSSVSKRFMFSAVQMSFSFTKKHYDRNYKRFTISLM
jgi:hypothetical protein